MNFQALIAGKDTSDESLGEYIGSAIKELARAKKKLVQEKLNMRNITHPDISTLDLQDEESIQRFIALENIECAFMCDPAKSVEHVAMLCKIVKSELVEGEHVEISIFQKYEEAKLNGKEPENLVTYFKVNIRTVPQDREEREPILQEFRTIASQIA